MSGIHYFGHIDSLLYEYYTAELAIPSGEREKASYRNPRLAELADTVVRLLEQEADHYRSYAARWRGEN
jgi:hypothetical protein